MIRTLLMHLYGCMNNTVNWRRMFVKRVTITTTIVAALLFSVIPCFNAYADVIRNKDGRPIAFVSNTGSDRAMERRSDTGTEMKFTHDGVRLSPVIW